MAGPRPTEIRRIALIDDNPRYVQLIRMIFETISKQKGVSEIEIVGMTNPLEIPSMPELLVAREIDLTVTDFNLRTITGAEIISRARSRGHQGFMIGITTDPFRYHSPFLEAGADLVVEKTSNFLETFRNLLV